MYQLFRPVLNWMPGSILSLTKPISVPALKLFSSVEKQRRQSLVRMFQQTDVGFLKWALGALLTWQPSPLEHTPVFQIHGRRDWVIPASRVDADEVIRDGGHLINLTHADEVNALIDRAADTTTRDPR